MIKRFKLLKNNNPDFYIIFFLGIISTVFILLLNFKVLKADSINYFDWDRVSVSVLPEASSSTLNKVYIYDNKYYITNEESTGATGTRIDLNTNYGDITLYSNFTDEDCSYLISNYSSNTQYIRLANGYNDTSFNNYSWYGSSRQLSTGRTGNELLICNSDGTLNFAYFNNGNIWHKDFYTTYFIVNSFVGNLGSWVNEHLSTTSFSGSTIYSWVEVNKFLVFDTIDHNDFYLFYNFDDISNFNVFSNYDMSSYSDFQKMVVVLGVNGFFLMLIGFVVYVLFKFIFKGLSSILG